MPHSVPLSPPPTSSLCLPCVILNVYILWNNWKHPSFCSCLNVIAGFIGDHYSNCSIIASTLALAAVHCLSTSRPCHGLGAGQQCVTLPHKQGGSLSLSLWPTWQHYRIPVLKRKKSIPFSLLLLSVLFTILCFSFSCTAYIFYSDFSLDRFVSALYWWIINVSTYSEGQYKDAFTLHPLILYL